MRRSWVLFLCLGTSLAAEDTPPWLQLAAPRSRLELRFEDFFNQQRAGSTRVSAREQAFQEKFHTSLSGVVYDKNFLSFDLGAGVTATQSHMDRDGTSFYRATDGEYQARVKFLPRHNVSGSLLTERSQSTFFNSYSGRSRIERTASGAHLFMKNKTFPLSISARDATVRGLGLGNGYSQRTQGVSMAGNFQGVENVSVSLRQDFDRFLDNNGPAYETAETSFRAWARPSERSRYEGNASHSRRTGRLAMERWRTEASAEWLPAPWRFRLGAQGDGAEIEGTKTSRRQGSVDTEHRLYQSLVSALGADAGGTSASGRESQLTVVRWSESYTKTVWGPLRFAARGNAVRRWDQSDAASVVGQVTIEPHVLLDGVTAFLSQLNPDVPSVLVENADTTVTYVPGVDYQLIPRGQLLEIRRVLTGNIANGDTVLVSYRHTVGGLARSRSRMETGWVGFYLGGRGTVFAAGQRQSETVVKTSTGVFSPTLESFRETSSGWNLRWKYLGLAQTWRTRHSNLQPSSGFRSNVRLGGEWGPATQLVGAWSHDRTRYADTGDLSRSNEYFGLLGLGKSPSPVFLLETRAGRTVLSGTPSRFVYGQVTLSDAFRSVEWEISNRLTRRRFQGSLSIENAASIRLIRRFP